MWAVIKFLESHTHTHSADKQTGTFWKGQAQKHIKMQCVIWKSAFVAVPKRRGERAHASGETVLEKH